MKTLKDHVILYDAACPMCDLYTNGFVKSRMLDANGRAPYQQMHGDLKKLVDCNRAVNEIALVNTKTGTVEYGVQSLFHIIEHSIPVLKPAFACKPFAWLAGKAYAVVSYNRRVIMPSASDGASAGDQPAFRLRYRLLYLLFTWFVTAAILTQYSQNMPAFIPPSGYYRELAVCGAQMVWQGLLVLWLNRNRFWDYIGNMMTISFAGGLVLLAGMGVLKSFSVDQDIVYALVFLVVAALMLAEHIRRTRLLGISRWMTVGWAGYRILLLFVLL